jgi:pyruvate-formate lyase
LAAEHGGREPDRVRRTAVPGLQARPVSWGLTVAVILLAQNETDDAHDLARQVAQQARSLQRRVHIIRLRALRDHHLDLPGLDHVIAIIDPEAAAS